MRPCTCEKPDCIACNLYRTSPKHRHFWDTGEQLPPERPSVCSLLSERVEFRAGCDSGWMCRHTCTSTDPAVAEHLGGVMEAVPGSDCQTCNGYTPRDS